MTLEFQGMVDPVDLLNHAQYWCPIPCLLPLLGYVKTPTSQHHSHMRSGETVLRNKKSLAGFKYIFCFPMKRTNGIRTVPFPLVLALNVDVSLYLS